MAKYIVTADKLNQRSSIPVTFDDKNTIVLPALNKGDTILGKETSLVPDKSLGKWIQGDNKLFYWMGGLQATTDIPASDPNYAWMTRLNLPQIWESYTGHGVGIAVLDTGVQIDNKDLVYDINNSFEINNIGSVIKGSSAKLTDNAGHGSHCAGLAGARNSAGAFIGVAPECTLYIGKFSDTNTLNSVDFLRAATAIITAADIEGVNIISLSWGIYLDPTDSNDNNCIQALQRALNYARQKGKIVVCSLGDASRLPDDTVLYPACLPGAIAIGIDPENQKNIYPYFNTLNNLVTNAPGLKQTSYWQKGTAVASGASQSTAVVAGLLALMMQKHGAGIDSREVLASLSRTVNFTGLDGKQYPLNILDGNNLLHYFNA